MNEIDLEIEKQTIGEWTAWFLSTRKELVCKAFVTGKWAELFIKTARECGAYKARFCADHTVAVYFRHI